MSNLEDIKILISNLEKLIINKFDEIDKKKTHFEFIIDIIRTKEFNEKIIGDISEIGTKTVLETIDYNKLLNDGYNGLYYSDNLVRVNSKMAEEDLRSDINHKYVDEIDIGDFPDVIRDFD